MEVAAGLGEFAALHDQGTGLHVPDDQVAPAEHKATAGDGLLQRVGVTADDFVPGRKRRAAYGFEPALPGRPVLVRFRESEEDQRAPARDGSVQDVRVNGGVARRTGRAEAATGSVM